MLWFHKFPKLINGESVPPVDDAPSLGWWCASPGLGTQRASLEPGPSPPAPGLPAPVRLGLTGLCAWCWGAGLGAWWRCWWWWWWCWFRWGLWGSSPWAPPLRSRAAGSGPDPGRTSAHRMSGHGPEERCRFQQPSPSSLVADPRSGVRKSYCLMRCYVEQRRGPP